MLTPVGDSASHPESQGRRLALVAGLALVYFLAGKLGLHFFGLIHPSASAVWPPTGVAIAALLLYGQRAWPAVFIGAFLVNVTTAGSIATSLGVAFGNTLEAVLAAYLVDRYAGGTHAFERPRDIFKFVGVAAMLSTMVSATIGVSSLTLGGYAPLSAFGHIWLTWWLGDAGGAVLFTPLLVLWANHRSHKLPLARWPEAALMLLSVLGVGFGIFFYVPYPLTFLCVPPLLWAAFRFGQREVVTAVALMSIVATWATATGHGQFVAPAPNQSLLVLQAFLAMITMTTLPIAALAKERAAFLERERAARAEAETANHAKDEFLAMLSHELRNPLGAISMAVTVLERVGMTSEEAGRWRKAIQRQTEHLTRLIEDLLDIARLTAGKMMLRREPSNLAEAVERAIRAVTETEFTPPRRLSVQLTPVWVNADPERLHQILTNLLANAIKYTPADGDIRVSVTSESRHAVVRIEDSGIGMPRELLARVFDLFAQGHQGLDRTKGGLGIGLTLVRRLVEMHEGRVEAHSEGSKRGSTFSVRLPRIDSPTLAPDMGGRHERSGLAQRVLIVEDNVDTRQALRVLLEMAGHVVYEAADGREGVAAALRLQPDFALIDIGLPLLDGYEVARRLKAAKLHTRLVAVTGYGRDEDKQQAQQAGFDAHLLKPVGLDRLRTVMQELANRRLDTTVPAP